MTAFKKLSIVVGNESCDLDSAVSAIVLAYIKYHELTKHQDSDEDDYDQDDSVCLLFNNLDNPSSYNLYEYFLLIIFFCICRHTYTCGSLFPK